MAVRCIRVILRPGTVDRARTLFHDLGLRRAELQDACERMGIRRERIFLDAANPGGPCLLMVQESDDFAETSRRFLSSTHPIDVDARAILTEVAAASEVIELLGALDPGPSPARD